VHPYKVNKYVSFYGVSDDRFTNTQRLLSGKCHKKLFSKELKNVVLIINNYVKNMLALEFTFHNVHDAVR
jgi:hypothetical protein